MLHSATRADWQPAPSTVEETVCRPAARTPGTHNRPRSIGGRYQRITLRLTADEYNLLAAAARPAGLTPAGFAAHAALTVAADHDPAAPTASGTRRADLATLQRNLIAARTAMHSLAQELHVRASRDSAIDILAGCTRAVRHLDDTSRDVHRLLRGDQT